MKENLINTYTCPSGHVLVTRDVDEGVTPFTKQCPYCKEVGRSAGYSNSVQHLTPTHEWYKPAYLERYTNSGMRQHCQQGGLAFRRIGEGDETETMKPVREGASKPDSFSSLAIRALTNTKSRFKS